MALARDLQFRELRQIRCETFRGRYQVSSSLVDRLGLQHILDGHRGCVNCLQWSTNGQYLASGSDDVKLILWDPMIGKKKAEIGTNHKGNIFSVKFMPLTDDRILASGAADNLIMVHDIETIKTIQTFANHMGRVKRLEVAQDCPNLLWSAAEDGTVMETDIREPPTETSILVNLMSTLGRGAEAKCLSINPRRPELIAVGANDAYVRVYDRRRLKAQLIEFPANINGGSRRYNDRKNFLSKQELSVSAPLDECANYFVPGHLPKKELVYMRKLRPLASTYVTFSPDGKELLVNLGGEQIYLFDIENPTEGLSNRFEFRDLMPTSYNQQCDPDSFLPPSEPDMSKRTRPVRKSVRELSPDVEALKLQANSEFDQKRFTNAISLYNEALKRNFHPILLGNRAAAFLKRKWDGDIYAALRDCTDALHMDPSHLKAHLRLIRCLIDLCWMREAELCLQYFSELYPGQRTTSVFKSLEKDVAESKTRRKSSNSRRDGNDTNASRIMFTLSDLNSDSNESDEPVAIPSPSPPKPVEPSQTPKAKIDPNFQEYNRRECAYDYSARFCGHCNTTTDIKEASFFGCDGQYIVAGSDDGRFFCWEKSTGNIVRVLQGDDSIVNCLQSHPSSCILATSGIDPVVRIWAPLPEDGRNNEHLVDDYDQTMLANQRRMNADPFEAILMDMGYRVRSGLRTGEARENLTPEDSSPEEGAVQCRTS